jgi:H+-transporting ATPase
MPAVMSVTMAVGAVALSKKKAIISKLMAIEEMAGMDILCSDKTGTITKNKLTVRGFNLLGDAKEEDVQLYGALASKAEDNDPLDMAIINKVTDNPELLKIKESCKQVNFKPFDPVSKRTEAEVETSEGTIKVSKGAPQVILALCADHEEIKDEVTRLVDEAGEHGFRTLGVGKTDSEGNWHYIGLIQLEDPPRDDSAETIQRAHDLGVKVKMITGDHGAIARETCKQVGIGSNILEAKTLNNLPDRRATELVENADGFSEVFPEHKFEIVDLLQKNDHIVGMTGDGVNDAPALKKADCGTAVEGATDAAKAAADIVLTAPGLSVVVDAIKEARRIFQRLQSYAIYRVGETIDVLFFTVIAILVWNKFPVNPIMIILLAVFNDFPIMAIASDNVRYSLAPEKWHMRKVIGVASVIGFLDVAFTLALFAFAYNYLLFDEAVIKTTAHTVSHEVVNHYQYCAEWVKNILPSIDYKQLQTLAFLQLLIAGNFTIFISRTVGHFWSIKPGKGLLWSSIISKLVASAACWQLTNGCFGLIPALPGSYIILVWVYAFVERMIISDCIKVWAYKLLDYKGIRFNRFGRLHH